MAKIENHTPVSIPIFRDKEMLDEVRISTINPLAHEVNKLSKSMSSACGSINSLDTEISDLKIKVEQEITNGSSSLKPISDKVEKNSVDIQYLKHFTVDNQNAIKILDDKFKTIDTTTLTARVTKTESDIVLNKSEIVNLKKDVTGLNSDVVSLQSKTPLLEKVVSDVTKLEAKQIEDVRLLNSTITGFGASMVGHEQVAINAEALVKENNLAVKANDVAVKKVEESLAFAKLDITNIDTTVKKVEKDVLDNTALIESKGLAIKANEEAIQKSNQSINILENRVDYIQNIVNAGGGTGGGGTPPPSQDLSGIIKDIADNKVAIDTNKTAIAVSKTALDSLSDQVDTNTADIAKFQPGGGVAEPTKFFVLPILGQSNGAGHGELPYDINGEDNIDPRIKQLGRYKNSGNVAADVVNPTITGYGDRFNELRPYADCNLKVIPATPCLDHIQNLFNALKSKQNGGASGFGMYLAKLLLPYIPSDYGILLVPCARGGSGFVEGSNNGSYDAARMYCSDVANKQGVGTNLAKASFDRVKFALELHKDNKLLPIIWVQGENDKVNPDLHLTRFEEYYNWYVTQFETAGLVKYLHGNTMNSFRWFCLGSTKWMLGCTTQKDYINDSISIEGDVVNRLSVYDNYYYLSNKYRRDDGSSPIVYIRTDIDLNGAFIETNAERGNGAVGSTREIHFSTHANQVQLPQVLLNAFRGYSPALTIPPGTKPLRQVRGGGSLVSTDNITFQYDKQPADFDINDKLLVHQKWANTSAGKLTNLATGSSAVLTGASTCMVVADSKFGAVMRFPDTAGGQIEINLSKGNTSFTKSIVFKVEGVSRTQDANIISRGPGGSDTDGVIMFVKGTLSIHPNYLLAQRIKGISINPCLVGGWNGQFNDWQHLVVTYNKTAELFTVYLNGGLIGHVHSNGLTLNKISIGSFENADSRLKGDVANYRIYERCLTHGEVGSLWHCDMKNYL